jgi:hypothetical protein
MPCGNFLFDQLLVNSLKTNSNQLIVISPKWLMKFLMDETHIPISAIIL